MVASALQVDHAAFESKPRREGVSLDGYSLETGMSATAGGSIPRNLCGISGGCQDSFPNRLVQIAPARLRGRRPLDVKLQPRVSIGFNTKSWQNIRSGKQHIALGPVRFCQLLWE